MPPFAQIRAAEAASADLVGVAAIMGHYVEHTTVTFLDVPPTVSEWERRLAELTAQGLPFLVAEAAGRVVGFAHASPWRAQAAYRYTLEGSVYLDPSAVGRGTGTALLSELITRAAAAGYRQMIAVIADAGEPASVRLHRRLGFAEAGRLHAVGFKHGRWIDTVLMQRTLDPG